jgi:hypothetical protein
MGEEGAGLAPKVREENLTTSKPERRGEGTWIPVMTVSETSHALLKTTSSRLGFVAGQDAAWGQPKTGGEPTIRCC